jgi:hypothetical protein
MDQSYFQWSVGEDAPLSFTRSFEVLREVGVSDREIGLLKSVLSLERGRIVEIQGAEIMKVAELDSKEVTKIWNLDRDRVVDLAEESSSQESSDGSDRSSILSLDPVLSPTGTGPKI